MHYGMISYITSHCSLAISTNGFHSKYESCRLLYNTGTYLPKHTASENGRLHHRPAHCFFLRWLQTNSRILHRPGHDCFHPNPIHMAIQKSHSRYTYSLKYKQQNTLFHILETLRLNIHNW